MSFDYAYDKLRGRIKEIYGTQDAFAKDMQLSRASLSYKLCGRQEWSQDEIMKACDLLQIPTTEITLYFFTLNVQEFEQKSVV